MKYRRIFLTCGLLVITLMAFSSSKEVSTRISLSDTLATEASTNYMPNVQIFQLSGSHYIYVYVEHAYYYDLDYDGRSDDILSIIHIGTLDGRAVNMVNDLVEYLRLPSGLTYYIPLSVYGFFDHVCIGIHWYNCATEPGWYNLRACVDSYSNYGYCYAEDNLDFDPPDTGDNPGIPNADFFIMD